MEDPKEFIGKLKAFANEGQEQAPEQKPLPPVPAQDTKEGEFMRKIRLGTVTNEDIPEAIRQEWMRSILGGGLFAYGVPLFGGKVRMVFSELTKSEAALHRKVSSLVPAGDTETQTKLCIILFLKEITGEVNVKVKDLYEEKDVTGVFAPKFVNDAYEKLCDMIPVGLSRMLVGAWSIYSTLVGTLSQEAFPDSF